MLNKGGIEVLVYDKETDDNKTMFFGIGKKFTFVAPKDYCGMGVDCSWTPIDSEGNRGSVSVDELEDGCDYVVRCLEYESGEEILYPERMDGGESECDD